MTMVKAKWYVVIGALCLALSATAEADEPVPGAQQNWHQWRGPLANGVAPEATPPKEWSESSNVQWKIALPGQGESTPIVWEDQVFILTAIDTQTAGQASISDPAAAQRGSQPPRGENRRRRGRGGRGGRGGGPTTNHRFDVISIDRNSGEIRWQKTATQLVPHEGHHQNHGFASASPMTDGRHLYVSFGSRGIYCYDLDGNLIWDRDLGDMRTRNGFGEGASPVIYGDSLIVLWDTEDESFLYSLDAATGETKWKVERDEPTGWSTPLIVEHEGRTQIVTNGTVRARGTDFATGETIWECGGQSTNAIPSPVASNGMAYCMSGYTKYAAFAIPLSSVGDITGSDRVAWQHNRGTPYVPSPLLYEDRLYFTKSRASLVTCLDVATGAPLYENKRLAKMSDVYASPVAANGFVYIVGRSGTTAVLKPGADFEVVATNVLEEPIDASPAFVGNQIFLRSKQSLYCLAAN